MFCSVKTLSPRKYGLSQLSIYNNGWINWIHHQTSSAALFLHGLIWMNSWNMICMVLTSLSSYQSYFQIDTKEDCWKWDDAHQASFHSNDKFCLFVPKTLTHIYSTEKALRVKSKNMLGEHNITKLWINNCKKRLQRLCPAGRRIWKYCIKKTANSAISKFVGIHNDSDEAVIMPPLVKWRIVFCLNLNTILQMSLSANTIQSKGHLNFFWSNTYWIICLIMTLILYTLTDNIEQWNCKNPQRPNQKSPWLYCGKS